MKRADGLYPRVMSALLAAATLLAAALLIGQCADIYIAGTAPQNLTETGVLIHDVYSPAIVAERFSRIAWAFWLWLALLAGALAARRLCPGWDERAVDMPPERRLALWSARLAPTPAMLRERRRRRAAALACGAVCAACGVMAGLYLFSPGRFASRELELVMGELLAHVAPWIALAFAALTALAYYRAGSARRELLAAKDAPRRAPATPRAARRPVVLAARVALGLAAIALLAAGIQNGGMYDVLVKAVNICTECIGLG